MRIRTYPQKSLSKNITGLINDIDLFHNRVILQKSEVFPDNSCICDMDLIVVNGQLTLGINGQKESQYVAGSLVFIPSRSKISLSNHGDEMLEVIMARAFM
jgi:hypothetical protein